MGKIIKNGIEYSGGGGASSAPKVAYDNTISELEATNVQDAIDELDTQLGVQNTQIEENKTNITEIGNTVTEQGTKITENTTAIAENATAITQLNSNKQDKETAITTSNIGNQSVNYANSAGSVAWASVSGKPSTYTPSGHTHDDRYYTESEVNNLLNGKANSNHSHSYLPLTGGTITGDLGVSGFITAYGNVLQNGAGGSLVVRNSVTAVNVQTAYALVVTNPGATEYKHVEASAFTQISSEKVKENIKNITDEEAQKLLDVNVVSFDYKESFGGQKNNVGVIAEQVKDVISYAVNVPNNYDESNFDEEKGINQDILSVDYTRFVPYLIKMTQIQQSKINELEDRLSKLEDN